MTDREAIYELAKVVETLARGCLRAGHEDAERASRVVRETRPSSVCPACGGSGRAVEAPEAVLEQLSQRLTNKFLHAPTQALGQSDAGREEMHAVVRRLFGLHGE